jgi:hypothetical protein
MGFDLKVMASYFRERRNEMLPTATLRFDRDTRLFSRLSSDAVPRLVHDLPTDLTVGSYEDQGLIFTQTDGYGKPLTWTTPATLARLESPDDLSPWNNAVLAFLRALPEDTRIVLYWC